MSLSICLVTSAHVSNNPRLIKEADALTDAGHRVRVVAVNLRPDLAARDAAVMRSRRWRIARVDADRRSVAGRWQWLRDAALQQMALEAWRRSLGGEGVIEQALSRHWRALARAAAVEPASLMVAHNLQALPAAAAAAGRLGARLVFDIEDLHVEELPNRPLYAMQRALVRAIESKYLPQCDGLIASSDGIADAIARQYEVDRPLVLLNVFPLSDPARLRQRTDGPVRLYWYSQVIGADRGLGEAIKAAGELRGLVEMHLRGDISAAYGDRLRAEIHEAGLEGQVHFHPPVAPDELIERAAEYDIGLALEQLEPANRALCVTNKLFTYMNAGLAIAASDTPGQRAIMEKAGAAGFLYPPGDADALRRGLERLVSDPAKLRQAQAAARAAAEARFSWEHESPRLIQYLEDLAQARVETAV